MSKVNVNQIIKESIVDGPGLRYTIFTQGCFHKCEGCHNPQTHESAERMIMEVNDIFEDIKNNSLLDGLTLSGGEPFLQADPLADLCIKIERDKNLNLDILCYTGYTWEELMKIKAESQSYNRLLSHIDFLIDGRFIKDKASLDVPYRGSANQRYIDVRKSLKSNELITVDDDKLKPTTED